MLATRDRDFDSGERGVLAPNLAGQVSSLDGSVVLTADMGSWLLAHFPWAPMAADAPVPSEWSLDEAAAIATQVDLDDYLMESDFLSSLWPDPAELGLPDEATDVVVDETDWR